jgi:hypothetical protein
LKTDTSEAARPARFDLCDPSEAHTRIHDQEIEISERFYLDPST